MRFNFQYVVPALTRNGKVPATVIRGGKEVKLQLPLARPGDFLIPDLRGEYPRFFLYGPLVFTSAHVNLGAQLSRLPNADITSPLFQRQNDKVRFPGEELVLIGAPMLRHKCVRGYNEPFGRVVADVNGVPIKNLRHLVEVLRDCKDEFVNLGLAGERAEILVLSRGDMAAVTREVMDDNGIPRRGSPELVEVWERKTAAR
jgi:hypothetical protein